ncbi:MAG: porin [Candidatus Azotimanducaceae bacterium]|jgi:porin
MPDSLCRRLLSFYINLGLFVAANTQITSVYGEGLTQHHFNIDYTVDVWANLRGGQKRGSAYLDNLDVTLGVDTETLFGLKNGNGYVHLLYNNSAGFSANLVGDYQVVSNIDSIHVIRLYELWYEQGFGESQSVKLGLYDLNSEFDAIAAAALFINSSHGIGAEYAQSGQNGPSIFPTTSLALRYFNQISHQVSVRAAILDGVPGNIDDFQKNQIRFAPDDGALLTAELEVTFAGGSPADSKDRGRLGVGTWYYTEPESRLNTNVEGMPKVNNRGIYGFYEHRITMAQGDTVEAWLRVGVAEPHVNQFDTYVGAGVVLSGFLPRKFEDSFGFAIAAAHNSDDYRIQAGSNARSQELNFELTWRIRLSERWVLQPDLQFIHNPGTVREIDDAIAFGLRFELNIF